jgi:thioesterase domain-containing protein
MDESGEPVPIGVPGELWIGGAGVARGYLGRPDLTAARFIPHPFRPEARVYRTGDVVRYRADGTLEYLGRQDEQVKVRGYRVELGEIEAVLRMQPGVREAAVVAREVATGDVRLLGFVVPAESTAAAEAAGRPAEWRAALARVLPDYMVPQALLLLDRWPLTPNGKLDRRALSTARVPPRGAVETPRDPLECQLTEIWEELLGVRPIGIRDNFFELGGHSLVAVRMLERVERVCGRKLPLATLFAGATIEHLAAAVLADDDAARRRLVPVQTSGTRRPLFFLHADINGGGFYCRSLARALASDQPFYALPPQGVNGEPVSPTIEAMAAEHLAVVRECQPHGPYRLAGYCNGALIAFEMARLLAAMGEATDVLLLINKSAANVRFRRLKRIVEAIGRWRRWSTERTQEIFVRARAFLLRWDELSAAGWRARGAFLMAKLCKLARHRRSAPIAAQPIVAMTRHENIVNQLHNRAEASYVPGPYAGRATVFFTEDEPRDPADPTCGWRQVAADVDVHALPGTHLTILTRHIDVLAKHLGRRLEEASVC